MRLNNGQVVMRKQYVGIYRDVQELVIASRAENGYLAWTTIPVRSLDARYRRGYLLHPRNDSPRPPSTVGG